MKKLILLCALLIFSLFQTQQCNAQRLTDSEKNTVIKPPIYPGCKGSEKKLRRCMANKISKHIIDYFIKDIAVNLGYKGDIIIYVIFKVDKDGSIVDVRAKGPHPQLANEAVRVINLLPRIKPGLGKGDKEVVVPYSLPITIRI